MKLKFLLFCWCIFLYKNAFSQENWPLLEFCTATWCEYCPCGDQYAEKILISKPNTLILAYHASDPFSDFKGNSIIASLGFNGIPTGVINRMNGIQDRNKWDGCCNVFQYIYKPSVSFNIIKNYDSLSKQLNVTTKVTSLREIDTACNISFVITEDNVIYYQSGNYECNGDLNYVHKWIVRNMVNGALGESITMGVWNKNTTLTKSWTTMLDSSWVDRNCSFGIFVYRNASPLSTSGLVLQTFKNGVTTPIGSNNRQIIPSEYSLSQNFPNPFHNTTYILFSIPKDQKVTLKLYDVTGKLIGTYFDAFINAGTYNSEFDGSKLSNGIYFYSLKTGDFVQTKKMIILK